MFGKDKVQSSPKKTSILKKNIVSDRRPTIFDYEMPSLNSKSTILSDAKYIEYDLGGTELEYKDQNAEYQFKNASFNPNKVFSPNVFVTQLQKRITIQEGKSPLQEELESFVL